MKRGATARPFPSGHETARLPDRRAHTLRCFRAILALAITAFSSSESRAEQEPEPIADEVVVVAPRSTESEFASPAKVTTITAEELRRTGERSLPRAIGRAAGIWIQESNLGGGSPVIRGLLGNHILIVVDGVRMNDATTRYGPNQILNTIDAAIVERVEILRGSASVRYGSDAIGGVISIWTHHRAPAGLEGDARPGGAFTTSYDSATEGGTGALRLGAAAEEWGALGVVTASDWDDLTAGGGEEQTATGYHSAAGFGALEWALAPERSLRLSALLHRDYEVPRTFQVVPGFGRSEPTFAEYDFALQEREHAILSYDDREGGGFADRAQWRLFARQYLEQRVSRRTGSSTRAFGQTEVETLGVGADWTRAGAGRHHWTWGFDLAHDRVDSFGRRTDLPSGAVTPADGEFAPDARYDSFGVFLLDEIALAERTDLTLGTRWSRFEFAFEDGGRRTRGNFDDLTASGTLTQWLADDWSLTATLAQGFQAPNLEDLANDGDFAGGTELANPDLEPAKSLTAELTLDRVSARSALSTAVFFTRIRDYLGRRLLDAGDPLIVGDELYLRSNAGRLDLWGIELIARRALGAADSPWSAEAAASWVRGRQYDGTVDASSGEAPLDGVEARRIPPLHGRFGVEWRNEEGFPRNLGDARLSLQWALDQDQLHPDDVSDPRIDPSGTDGWAIWILDIGGPLSERASWSVALINLLDANYRVHGSAIDGPGRSVVATLEVVF